MPRRFSRPATLQTRACFLRVQSQGKRFRGVHMLVLVAANLNASRIGYTVSRRVGNAVVRNRVRRRLKEIVRLSAHGLTPQLDYVVIAFPTAAKQSYDVLRMELLCLLERIQTRRSTKVLQPPSCSRVSLCIG